MVVLQEGVYFLRKVAAPPLQDVIDSEGGGRRKRRAGACCSLHGFAGFFAVLLGVKIAHKKFFVHLFCSFHPK